MMELHLLPIKDLPPPQDGQRLILLLLITLHNPLLPFLLFPPNSIRSFSFRIILILSFFIIIQISYIPSFFSSSI